MFYSCLKESVFSFISSRVSTFLSPPRLFLQWRLLECLLVSFCFCWLLRVSSVALVWELLIIMECHEFWVSLVMEMLWGDWLSLTWAFCIVGGQWHPIPKCSTGLGFWFLGDCFSLNVSVKVALFCAIAQAVSKGVIVLNQRQDNIFLVLGCVDRDNF